MNTGALIDRLSRFPKALRGAVEIASSDDLRWSPQRGTWSIHEVICHLADEEEEDFADRLRRTLAEPVQTWPKLDLDGVSERRGYLSRDVHSELARFCTLRDVNVKWLREVAASDRGGAVWTRSYPHPTAGEIPAGELLTAYAAHDALHLRQIAKRLFELAARDGAPYPTKYAGEWKA
ncbi:MAG: DinB family protein [Phycisphaerales bacterium]|nr:DinB family protein [Phycisphaerales bacterium]